MLVHDFSIFRFLSFPQLPSIKLLPPTPSVSTEFVSMCITYQCIYNSHNCQQVFLHHLTLWTYGLTKSSNLYRILSITFTKRCLSWSSKVGDIRSGSIWLKSGPAPNSRALSVIWRRAALRIGGVPFFIFSRSFIIFRSFCSSGLKLSSSTST